MAFALRNGQGTLWPNHYKQAGDNRPDFKGTEKTLEGEMREFAAWWKGEGDGRYLSTQAQMPREQTQPRVPPPQPAAPAPSAAEDLDLPF